MCVCEHASSGGVRARSRMVYVLWSRATCRAETYEYKHTYTRTHIFAQKISGNAVTRSVAFLVNFRDVFFFGWIHVS